MIPDPNRLPLNVKPTHYDVTLQTDLENLTFTGYTKIKLDVKEDTKSIVLNCGSALSFQNVALTSNTSLGELKPSSQKIEGDRLSLEFESTIPANSTAELKIGPFTSPLGDSMTGYYRAAYKKDGENKHYALTQFEAIDARNAFPCWDEPLLKATFSITMISRADTVNLSNMPAASEDVYTPGSEPQIEQEIPSIKALDGKWKITKFQPTPIMSTYIVAFANGPFTFLEDSVKMPSGKTVALRIYTTPELIHQAQYALQVKKKVLPVFEEVFDVEFPLPKLDTLVAEDFDAGAMENWGLITGRTTAFLLDPKSKDLNAKKQVFSTQSHEVAHMWFGNITTMEWWNYLYLNEGFATLMGEVIIPHKVFPEFKPRADFITDHLERALALDAKLSSHPIEVECPNAEAIGQIFDALSYSKAASVLRMLSDYVGEDKFLKGVSVYLKNKLYGNGITEDLWQGISTTTGQDVIKLMENWVKKIGFPVITVTDSAKGIEVRQDRFLETGIAGDVDNTTIWNVPLNILTADSAGKAVIDRTALLSERSQTFDVDTSKPFKLNGGTAGSYRVLYTPERLEKIAAEAAKPDSLFSVEDRMGLLNDSMALSKAGLQKLSSALTLIDNFRSEKEFLILDVIAGNLSGLSSTWWESKEIVENLDAFRQQLFGPLVKELGYEYPDDEPTDITRLRTTVIGQAASAKHEGVIKELQSRFKAFVETGDETKIPAALERITYQTAVKYGGKAEHDALKKIIEAPKTPGAKIAAIIGLGSTQSPELIEDTFKYTMTSARDQDFVYYFRGLTANPAARRQVATFFKDNYDTLYARFKNNSMLRYLVESSFNTLSTQKDYDDIKTFFADKDTSKYNLGLAQTLDTVRARIAYIDRSTEDLDSWLKEWKGKQNASARF
ncbi:leucyl aminopeptidase [Cylindrobasidium torrendii FP15055 ss-10]|uniref:Aminopeptidase n=1 Tax=Cylindrobasidium torrendii FP15055 ss-10 TaxID=1314674 RepID=A0A0D7BF58_9AGAR|nr:leucyl aminopeptidase [Cylindrobasidium torrendii FP15055 ss-10]